VRRPNRECRSARWVSPIEPDWSGGRAH